MRYSKPMRKISRFHLCGRRSPCSMSVPVTVQPYLQESAGTIQEQLSQWFMAPALSFRLFFSIAAACSALILFCWKLCRLINICRNDTNQCKSEGSFDLTLQPLCSQVSGHGKKHGICNLSSQQRHENSESCGVDVICNRGLCVWTSSTR